MTGQAGNWTRDLLKACVHAHSWDALQMRNHTSRPLALHAITGILDNPPQLA